MFCACRLLIQATSAKVSMVLIIVFFACCKDGTDRNEKEIDTASLISI